MKQDAATVVQKLLDADKDADDWKEATELSRVNSDLQHVLNNLQVGPERVVRRYGDVYVMCPSHEEAYAIAMAGPWKSMAQVTRTNPEHPDAEQYPWLADIPFANLSDYIDRKTNGWG